MIEIMILSENNEDKMKKFCIMRNCSQITHFQLRSGLLLVLKHKRTIYMNRASSSAFWII